MTFQQRSFLKRLSNFQFYGLLNNLTVKIQGKITYYLILELGWGPYSKIVEDLLIGVALHLHVKIGPTLWPMIIGLLSYSY